MTTKSAEQRSACGELAKLLGSRYKIGRHLGSGGAGIAFLVVEQAAKINRVAKLLRSEVRNDKQIRRDFQSEAKKLASLRHPNLVTVYEQSSTDQTPFFVMEFIDGKPLDAAVKEMALAKPRGGWILDVRAIFLQIADVVAYLHSQHPRPLLHLDIKPDNVLLVKDYRGKARPILLDFGIARFAESPDRNINKAEDVRGTFPMWPRSYYPMLSRMTNEDRSIFRIKRRLLNPELDLHLVGQTLSLCIQSGVENDSKGPDRWDARASAERDFLQNVVARLDIDQKGAPNYLSALELRTSLRRVDLVAGRASHATGSGVIKVPGRKISSYGGKMRKLTDWPQFQRLRGIKQLGFTSLVYPGAVHTRFEHSLGVYQNTVEVLDQITGPYGDLRFRSVVAEEELLGTVIAGLMHDIGHYPFAHQFRVRGIFPRHEERSLEVIESKECKKLIVESFGLDAHAAAINVLKAVLAHESPANTETSRAGWVSRLPKHFQVLRAVLSGPIDVDKLDYVHRDAYHAGVPYGQIVDVERFLQSLRVWWEPDASPHLVLSDKGRVCAEALIFARYMMTSEVYWNHAVRAYAAMLSAATASLGANKVKMHLWDTDDQFLSWLGSEKLTEWLVELVQKRRPYRRAFVHQRLGGRSPEQDQRLFSLLEEIAKGDSETRSHLQRVVAKALSIGSYRPHEIVLDVPQGVTMISAVEVFPEGHLEPGHVGPISAAIGENFDGFVRKARIFVHPNLMPPMSIADSTLRVREALISDYGLNT